MGLTLSKVRVPRKATRTTGVSLDRPSTRAFSSAMSSWMSVKSSWKTWDPSVTPTHWPSTSRTPLPGPPQVNRSHKATVVATRAITTTPATPSNKARFGSLPPVSDISRHLS